MGKPGGFLVEVVFLLAHIGFVGVCSGVVSQGRGGGVGANGSFGGTIGGGGVGTFLGRFGIW